MLSLSFFRFSKGSVRSPLQSRVWSFLSLANFARRDYEKIGTAGSLENRTRTTDPKKLCKRFQVVKTELFYAIIST